MKGFFWFIASSTGRVVRAAAGVVLILAAVGLVPLAAGLFDWYVFAPLFGLPFVGLSLRRTVEDK